MDAFNAANLTFILNGFWLTIRISALAIVFSIIFGTVLAMIKQYCRGKLSIFRWIVTAYIELFRCTPNLLCIILRLIILFRIFFFNAVFHFVICFCHSVYMMFKGISFYTLCIFFDKYIRHFLLKTVLIIHRTDRR